MIVPTERDARVLALLKRVEWVGKIQGFDLCPACRNISPEDSDKADFPYAVVGHAADCELAALIRELEG